jgi:hypothetical protein
MLLGSIQVLPSVLKEHLAPDDVNLMQGKLKHAAHPELYCILTESRGGKRGGGGGSRVTKSGQGRREGVGLSERGGGW